jgi:hypothetical protein
VGLKLNGAHQFLAYANDVNLLVDNIDTIKKNTETLIDAGTEVGLEINVEKTKYMLLSRRAFTCRCVATCICRFHSSHLEQICHML